MMNFWNTKLAQKIGDQLVALSNFWWKKTKGAVPVAPTKKPAAPRKPRTTKAKKEQ